jgi:Ca-activated chloride channel homolog
MSFASPWFLLALLVVPLTVAFAVWARRRRSRYAVEYTNLDLLASVAGSRGARPLLWLPLALFVLALVAAATALARPRAAVAVAADRATVVLLVDVSGSMRADDVKPTRLGAAQAAMDQFVNRLPHGIRIGLVSFSSSPDLLVPPTQDRSQVHEGIDLLVPEAGTAIGDGLSLAVQVAKSAVSGAPRDRDGKVPAVIVLLSDGAQTSGALTPLQGAQLAEAAGIRVFTIALGTKNGTLDLNTGPYGFGFGGGGGYPQHYPVPPDPTTMAAIARATGGSTFQATSAEKVQKVYSDLGSSLATKKATREVSSWFAGAAALLLLGALGATRLIGPRLP